MRFWISITTIAYDTTKSNYEPNTVEEGYSHKFKHVRSLIERYNGVLNMRFRYIILYKRTFLIKLHRIYMYFFLILTVAH